LTDAEQFEAVLKKQFKNPDWSHGFYNGLQMAMCVMNHENINASDFIPEHFGAMRLVGNYLDQIKRRLDLSALPNGGDYSEAMAAVEKENDDAQE